MSDTSPPASPAGPYSDPADNPRPERRWDGSRWTSGPRPSGTARLVGDMTDMTPLQGLLRWLRRLTEPNTLDTAPLSRSHAQRPSPTDATICAGSPRQSRTCSQGDADKREGKEQQAQEACLEGAVYPDAHWTSAADVI